MRGVRHELGLPLDGHLLVSAAWRARTNPYKDFAVIEAAMHHLARLLPDEDIFFICFGDAAAEQRVGNMRLRYLPFQTPAQLAKYMQAADIFVHAAKAENFGLVTAEAQACGTPVVSTAVGGLREVVRDGESGLLTPPGDAEQLAQGIRQLLTNPELRRRLGEQGADYARRHWAEPLVVDNLLNWFAEGATAHKDGETRRQGDRETGEESTGLSPCLPVSLSL